MASMLSDSSGRGLGHRLGNTMRGSDQSVAFISCCHCLWLFVDTRVTGLLIFLPEGDAGTPGLSRCE